MREGLLEAFKHLRDYTACNHCQYQKSKDCVKGGFCIWNEIEEQLKKAEAFDIIKRGYCKDYSDGKSEGTFFGLYEHGGRYYLLANYADCYCDQTEISKDEFDLLEEML